jgi:hypothetical protein
LVVVASTPLANPTALKQQAAFAQAGQQGKDGDGQQGG